MIKLLLPVKVVQIAQKVKNIFLIFWLKVPQPYRKILKITGIVFTSLLVLMLILSLVFSLKKQTQEKKKVTPTPVPQMTAVPEVITNPSRYATDSAILKVEEDLAEIGKDLDSLQVNEVNLLPPRLDFNINFEK